MAIVACCKASHALRVLAVGIKSAMVAVHTHGGNAGCLAHAVAGGRVRPPWSIYHLAPIGKNFGTLLLVCSVIHGFFPLASPSLLEAAEQEDEQPHCYDTEHRGKNGNLGGM